jgi:Ca2+-binding EF-hand superfamily protein
MKASRLMIAAGVAALLPFAAAVAQTPPSPPAEDTTQPAQQGATFESLDTNSDGKISKTEAAVNASVTEQFSRYDRNGNGFIEKEEVGAANTTPPNTTPQQ